MDDRVRRVLIEQLLAVQSQLDATLTMLGYEDESEEEVQAVDGQDGGCDHPADRLKNMTTMSGGNPTWMCGLCGEMLSGPGMVS